MVSGICQPHGREEPSTVRVKSNIGWVPLIILLSSPKNLAINQRLKDLSAWSCPYPSLRLSPLFKRLPVQLA